MHSVFGANWEPPGVSDLSSFAFLAADIPTSWQYISDNTLDAEINH